MEGCYARMLRALVAAEPKDKLQQLEAVIQEYETLSKDFPDSGITHFRLHVIYSQLGDSIQDGKQRADRELEIAARPLEADAMFRKYPGHWVRSTICRRRAWPLFEEAGKLRRQLRDESNPERERLARNYRDVVRKAFVLVYEDFPYDHGLPEMDSESQVFLELEAQRRINNIVYMAALFLEAKGEYAHLHPSFRRADLMRLTKRLYPDGIEAVTEVNIVHTIGCALHVLGEIQLAKQVGERLIRLIYDQGETFEGLPETSNLIADALRWKSESVSQLERVAS